MDRGYLARIQEREPLIRDKPNFTVGAGPLVDPAIEELYTEIMIDYLPHRYPTIFKTSGQTVHNLVTGSSYPLSTANLTPEKMLQLLGMNVEEDFYFMCPDEEGEYRLRGYIACFPGGFLSPARLGESVREIHRPVPGYEQRLGRSVDRYFSRLQPGQFIGRMNVSFSTISAFSFIRHVYRPLGAAPLTLYLTFAQWSLQVNSVDLFRVGGNNYYPDKGEAIGEEKFHPHFDQCFLRVEHQTLTALPRSKAIMFCVRSYMTPLAQIRAEGDGPKLAEAIESMPEKLGMYKMRHFWGSEVLPWLKGELAVAPTTGA